MQATFSKIQASKPVARSGRKSVQVSFLPCGDAMGSFCDVIVVLRDEVMTRCGARGGEGPFAQGPGPDG